MNRNKNIVIFILLTTGIVIFDHITKFFAKSYLVKGESINVIGDIFRITYIENDGIAFGSMANSIIFVYLLPAIIMAILVFYSAKYIGKNKRIIVGTSMCLGGGIANYIDRILSAKVVDFFDLKNFAVFNIADIFISLGALIFIWSLLSIDDKEE